MLALSLKTQDIYERNGQRFDRERNKVLNEKNWIERFTRLLSPGAKILDVGCGTGEPIARYLIEQGFCLTGLDFSDGMLEMAKSRFPNNSWYLMDMCKLELRETFEGIIAWHSFFHLTPDNQRVTLQRFAKHLMPGGALMLTVGPGEGEVLGHVGDDKVYHASLSFDEYELLLQALDIKVLKFVPDDPECDGASVLLAQKNA